MLSFLQCMFLVSLSNIRWLKLWIFIFGSSILFHWSLCLFSWVPYCFYYYCSITVLQGKIPWQSGAKEYKTRGWLPMLKKEAVKNWAGVRLYIGFIGEWSCPRWPRIGSILWPDVGLFFFLLGPSLAILLPQGAVRIVWGQDLATHWPQRAGNGWCGQERSLGIEGEGRT